MKYTCEFCRGEFARPSNLSKHQRTAKYCLVLQQEKEKRDSQLRCEYCDKVLSRSDSLQRHYVTCIEFLIYQRVQGYEKELTVMRERLLEKEQQIAALNDRLWELTNVSINKPHNNYTHIDAITINETIEDKPTVTEIIDKIGERFGDQIKPNIKLISE